LLVCEFFELHGLLLDLPSVYSKDIPSPRILQQVHKGVFGTLGRL